MAKKDKAGSCRFIFNDKIFVYFINNDLYLTYKIDDLNFFLSFSFKMKKFSKSYGFGEDRKGSVWWKNSSFVWGEIGEKDED